MYTLARELNLGPILRPKPERAPICANMGPELGPQLPPAAAPAPPAGTEDAAPAGGALAAVMVSSSADTDGARCPLARTRERHCRSHEPLPHGRLPRELPCAAATLLTLPVRMVQRRKPKRSAGQRGRAAGAQPMTLRARQRRKAGDFVLSACEPAECALLTAYASARPIRRRCRWELADPGITEQVQLKLRLDDIQRDLALPDCGVDPTDPNRCPQCLCSPYTPISSLTRTMSRAAGQPV